MDTSSSRNAFILDFDGTITTKDTISTLAKFGIASQKANGYDLTAAWDEIVARYGEDYSKHITSYNPAKRERKTLAEEIAYCRSLKDVELRSFERVGKSGIFRGIADGQWENFGRDAVHGGDVKVRKGFDNFVERISTSGGLWGVVSVNFSSKFIRGVLEASAGLKSAEVKILANHPNEEGTLAGPKGPVLATSDAKLASSKGLLQFWKNGSKKLGRSAKIVYVGDSGTDIECLTADGVVGIVVSEDGEGSLMEIFKRVEVDIVHVSKYEEGKSSSVYWARDFEEITKSPIFSSSSK